MIAECFSCYSLLLKRGKVGRKRGEEVGEKVVEREMLELLSGIDSNKPQISREGGWWEIHVRMDPSLIVDAGPEPQSPLL